MIIGLIRGGMMSLVEVRMTCIRRQYASLILRYQRQVGFYYLMQRRITNISVVGQRIH